MLITIFAVGQVLSSYTRSSIDTSVCQKVDSLNVIRIQCVACKSARVIPKLPYNQWYLESRNIVDAAPGVVTELFETFMNVVDELHQRLEVFHERSIASGGCHR